MSESTTVLDPTEEEVTPQADPSEAPAPPDSDDVGAPPSTTEEETPDAEDRKPEAQETTPKAERSIAEIQAAINAEDGTVSGAELRRFDSYQQSLRDRLSVIEQARTEAASAFESHEEVILNAWKEEVAVAEEEGRQFSRTLFQARVKDATKALQSASERAAVADLDGRLLDSLTYLKGNDPEQRITDAKLSTREKVEEFGRRMLEVGQRMGPGEGYVVMTLAERDAMQKAAANEAKGGGTKGEPGSNGREGRSAGKSDAEKLADPKTPVNELIEIRSRQRAAGG